MIDRILSILGLMRAKLYGRYVAALQKQHSDYCAANIGSWESAKEERQEYRDKITFLLNLLHSLLRNTAEVEAKLLKEECDTGSWEPSYPIGKERE